MSPSQVFSLFSSFARHKYFALNNFASDVVSKALYLTIIFSVDLAKVSHFLYYKSTLNKFQKTWAVNDFLFDTFKK